jgi:uracil-DNA glycosylase
VLEGHAGQRAYLLGQAPGVVEGEERRPWRGRAGQTLRRWLGLDEEVFYTTFYCASVTRCYPGRAPAGGGDRTPAAREQELCSFWREWELRLLQPRLIVAVGGLAIRQLLGLPSLDAGVGQTFPHGEAVAVPLPHPSGVSRWMNDAENQQRVERAVEFIHAELVALNAALGPVPPTSSPQQS